VGTGADIAAGRAPNEATEPTSWHELRVAHVTRETADALSIVFDVPAELAHAFRYRAGQFLTLKVPYEGKDLSRCYSLASSPDWKEEHKVTVKRVPEGRVSKWLVDNVRAGDVLRVAPPGGRFTLYSDRGSARVVRGRKRHHPRDFASQKRARDVRADRASSSYANTTKPRSSFVPSSTGSEAGHGDRVDSSIISTWIEVFCDAAGIQPTWPR
jgi:3-ketosteroid 9alpha-monooxygenase subunit B